MSEAQAVTPLTLDVLRSATVSAAGFRCRRLLQPAAGDGDTAFPPAIAGAVRALEGQRGVRRSGPVQWVLLDSVRSQANRMELALRKAVDAKRVRIPGTVGKPTSLQVPHRLANATPIFEMCPAALVLGTRDPTDLKGFLGPRFERALVSEIVGAGVGVGDLHRGVRLDPLDGVTIECAEQVTTLSLICLRRLCFPVNGTSSRESDTAARAVLAALGLCAATLAFESGIALRSRSLLRPDRPMTWELLSQPGSATKSFSVSKEAAIQLLDDAVVEAKKARLPWAEDPTLPRPSPEPCKAARASLLEEVTQGATARTEMLVFGIRYLNGFVAISEPDSDESVEWPPHPARVFMALAAAHFQTGSKPAERVALTWLEQEVARPPAMRVPEATARAVLAPLSPVQSAPGVIPLRLLRSFARVYLEDDTLYIAWAKTDPPELVRRSLEGLCAKVTRIGHSTSLVQMSVAGRDQVGEPSWSPDDDRGVVQLRVPGPGTLAELERRYHREAVATFADRRKARSQCGKEVVAAAVPARGRPQLSVCRGDAPPARSAETRAAPGAISSACSPSHSAGARLSSEDR